MAYSETLKLAAFYRSRGISTIPLRKGTKLPQFSWNKYRTEYASADELIKWFGKDKYNIGIVTGELSGIYVIDLDNVDQDLVARAGIKFKTIPTAKTGSGLHLYFKYEGQGNTQCNSGGIPDARGEGGYVVAPPSLHENGNVYEWVVSLERELASAKGFIA